MNPLDINEVMANMAAAIKGSVSENWKEVKPVANQFLERRKERFALMAELRISGELSAAEFSSRLDTEKLLLEAELHTIAIIQKAIAQNAANAAIKVLEKAVQVALKSL